MVRQATCVLHGTEEHAADPANVLITRHSFAPFARSHDRFTLPRADARLVGCLELSSHTGYDFHPAPTMLTWQLRTVLTRV